MGTEAVAQKFAKHIHEMGVYPYRKKTFNIGRQFYLSFTPGSTGQDVPNHLKLEWEVPGNPKSSDGSEMRAYISRTFEKIIHPAIGYDGIVSMKERIPIRDRPTPQIDRPYHRGHSIEGILEEVDLPRNVMYTAADYQLSLHYTHMLVRAFSLTAPMRSFEDERALERLGAIEGFIRTII